MESDVVFNVKEREFRKIRTKKKLFISVIILVISIVILDLISFLIS